MNSTKPRTGSDQKTFRKPPNSKPPAQEILVQHERKVPLQKVLESPRKDGLKGLTSYKAWSGRKRLAVARQEQSGQVKTVDMDQQKPTLSTISVDHDRQNVENLKEYGLSVAQSRQKSAQNDSLQRVSSEYFYRRSVKEQNIERLCSPQVLSARESKANHSQTDVLYSVRSHVQHVQDLSVKKNCLQDQRHIQQQGMRLAAKPNEKKIESLSTGLGMDTEPTDLRLPSTSIMAEEINFGLIAKTTTFDLRSSTTLARQLPTNESHDGVRYHLIGRQSRKPPSVATITLSKCRSTEEAFYEINGAQSPTINGTPYLNGQSYDYNELKNRLVKLQKVLGEKQKEINRLEFENHNLNVQLKNSHIKIAELEKQIQKQVNNYQTSEICIKELRAEILRLRTEAASSKAKNVQDAAKNQKQIKQQYSQLIHQKNTHISKLNLTIKEKQAEMENARLEVNRLQSQIQKQSIKETEMEKLIEYYRKESKGMGVELSNTKKKLDAQVISKSEAQSKGRQLESVIRDLETRIAALDQQLKDKDREVTEKLKQSQHEKNLLYDSMTNAIRIKDTELISLRKQVSGKVTDQERRLTLEERANMQQLKKQITQLNNDITQLKTTLQRQIEEKNKLANDKKQLTTSILQRQKKEDEEKYRLYQSQSLKSLNAKQEQRNPEIQKLSTELTAKNSELLTLGKTLKTIQQRYSNLESLLSSTNQELLKLRLQMLSKKVPPY